MDKRGIKVETDFADAALALLMDWSAEADGERLWDEYHSAEQQMPPELDIRCRNEIQKFIRKCRRRAYFIRTLQSARKTAACLAVVLVLAVSLITSVEALRVPVLNFFLKYSPRATSILFQHPSENTKSPLEELQGVLKFFVPEGYTLELEQIHRDEYSNPPAVTSVFLAFQDSERNLLTIHVSPAEGVWNVDTEDASVSEIILEGQKAILIENAPEISVYWHNKRQGLLYGVTANAMDKTDFMEYVTLLAQETRWSNAGFTE